MDDLLGEFLTGTAEGLAELDTELVRLEQNPNDPNLLGKIFRIVHTIKGTCGFLDLPRLERLVLLCEILEVTPDELLGFASGASAQPAPRTSPAFDEMMTVMRHFFLQMESRLSEEERKELMQTISHLQRLITLIKKKEPEGMPRRTRKTRTRQQG